MTDRKQALTYLLHEIEAGTWPGDVACVIAGIGNIQIFRAFNGSLDAAKALHEAVLPGSWHYDIDSEACGVCVFQLGVNNAQIGEHNNPARAWLIAILKALIEMEKDNG